MATKETKDLLSGKYGKTVKPFNEEVQKKCIGDAEVITCRPADLIPDELDTLRSEMEQWSQQDEDVLSYALFPQVATDFFKYREAQQTKDRSVAAHERTDLIRYRKIRQSRQRTGEQAACLCRS